MPVGVSWLRYLSFTGASLVSMMAGAQCVHMFYKPLDNLDELVEQSLKERLKVQREMEKRS
ncbi:PREDICTED: uncharacterized protein C12orf73 homolog [Dinoponera quadriceps]|uniref:Uncharacterized protein C12orf73 homolog n=1 Tax=Dinoponera quadriceps TaxID=609295 RepID=A0A6P3XTZ7_DINQU|nr:PREDICTED: uncharacterized protein C12orf73 homolog [Dinoponera quadriceps]